MTEMAKDGPAEMKPPVEAAPASVEIKTPAEAQPPVEMKRSDGLAAVRAVRDSDGLHLTFPVSAATPAALFRRADTLWLLFDTTTPFDIAPIRSNGAAMIAEANLVPLFDGQGGPASGSAVRRCPRWLAAIRLATLTGPSLSPTR